MGNGASSSVKNININSSKQSSLLNPRKDETSTVGSQKSKPRKRISQADLPHVEESIDREEAMQAIKNQLANVESEKLDLLDRIHLLEAQIDYLNTENLLQRQKDGCEETIHAKDQYIKKLEKETEIAQGDVSKLKLKLKKKVKIFSTQLTEVKQEASIQAFELRDEVNRLTEENTCLLEKLRLRGSKGDDEECDVFMLNNPRDDGRSKLILELSQQLNEQFERIEELEENIKERDKIIKDLKDVQINNKDEKSLKATTTELSVKKVTANADSKKSPEKLHSDPEMSEMKAIMEEMKSLRRQKPRSSEKSLVKENSRGSSGQSRDSGVISPDVKIGTELTNGRPASAVSTLSALSLTESEHSRFSKHNVVHSAPVRSTRSKPPIYTGSATTTTTMEQFNTRNDLDGVKQSNKNPSSKRKKRFALKQRLESESGRPDPKLNSFTDTHSDVDAESEMLLESFRQDPMLNILSPSRHVSVVSQPVTTTMS